MTYCLGIKVRSGLVAIADTRITSGTETTMAKKISVHEGGRNSLFLMTSGLRSIRDKAVTYFEELFEEESFKYTKMYQAVNVFGEQLRRVALEDKRYLAESGLVFNLYAIVGGQLENDKEHKLYMLYPEGNWIEIGQGSPFAIIGNSGYGKPILNRALTYESSLRFAFKTGFLSFDSTRVSANDVGYPIDIAMYQRDSFTMQQYRLQEEDTAQIGQMWASKLKNSIDEIPESWMDAFLPSK
ncbi:MAG: peptidase [Haliscomenobacter sp.]|nr:peptidase [Haliscomenobacter sp.]MBK8880647.1 peptidase [Haliscomenobacter sp.]